MISKEKMNRCVPTAKATKWKKVGMTSVGNIAMWVYHSQAGARDNVKTVQTLEVKKKSKIGFWTVMYPTIGFQIDIWII